jgi:hypothetical protein
MEGAAMHDAETVVEVIARDQLCGDPFGRNMRDLEAEKFGKWRLLVGRVVHSNPPAETKTVRARTLSSAPFACKSAIG